MNIDDGYAEAEKRAIRDRRSFRVDRWWAVAAYLGPLFGLGAIAPVAIWLFARRNRPALAEEAGRAFDIQIGIVMTAAIMAVVWTPDKTFGLYQIVTTTLAVLVVAVFVGMAALVTIDAAHRPRWNPFLLRVKWGA